MSDDFPTAQGGVPVGDVIRQVKLAIRQFGRELKPEDGIALQSVDLTLNVVTIKTVEGKPEFTIPFINLKVGTKLVWTQENTQAIVVSLEPDKPDPSEELERGFPEQLVEGLRVVRDAVRNAGPDPPHLKLTKGSVELKFVVTQTGTIELLILGAEASRSLTHSVLVTVGAPA